MVEIRARSEGLRWAPSVVLSIGIIVTVGASLFVARTARDTMRSRIESERRTAGLLVRARLEHFEHLLRSFAELTPASPPRTAATALVGVAQDLGFIHHGITHVGWIPSFPTSSAAAGATVSLPGGFTVRLPGRAHGRGRFRGQVDPLEISARDALAIDRAQRLLRPIAYASGPGVPLHLRIFVPVRSSSNDLRGFAFVDAPTSSLLRDLRGPLIGEPHLTVGREAPAAGGASRKANRPASDRRFSALGLDWDLVFGAPSPVGTSSPVVLVALGGSFVTLLLTFVTWSESRARARAQAVTLQLRASEDALRRADRAKDDFLAMLGHELRNPLGALSTALKVLRLRLPVDPYVQRSLDVAERQVRHQTRLVDDLLDVSRITVGKVQLERVNLDLREIARRAAGTVQASSALEQRVLEWQATGGPVVVEGDAVRLEQVVSNLLTNAVRHTSPEGHVAVEVSETATHGVVTVRDDGVGIRPEDAESVFQLFTQLDVTVDRTKGGLGVGLAVAKRVVELHGGVIEVRSAGLGQGSEFVVRIPLAAGEAVSLAQHESTIPPGGYSVLAAAAEESEGLRVLVVEDNDDARAMMVDLVTVLGHRVDAVADGRAALEYLEQRRPDVALVDLGLPGLDGFELARQVHRVGCRPLRLVALSGYAQREDRRHAREAGFDLHLAKPVNLQQLEHVLRRPAASYPPHSSALQGGHA